MQWATKTLLHKA